MRIAQDRLTIETAPREIKEITGDVARWTARQKIARGLLTVYIPHTSASLLMVTRPAGTSTATSVTPAILPTSAVTDPAQWLQVMPRTV